MSRHQLGRAVDHLVVLLFLMVDLLSLIPRFFAIPALDLPFLPMIPHLFLHEDHLDLTLLRVV